MSKADGNVLDRRTLGVVHLLLSCNVAFIQQSEEDAMVSFLEMLENIYEKPSTTNRLHLMHFLFNLRMEEGLWQSILMSIALLRLK